MAVTIEAYHSMPSESLPSTAQQAGVSCRWFMKHPIGGDARVIGVCGLNLVRVGEVAGSSQPTPLIHPPTHQFYYRCNAVNHSVEDCKQYTPKHTH